MRDGDQVLHEIRADGSGASGGPLEDENRTGAAAYGRVLYTHGAGIDHPLSVVRVGYVPPSSIGAEADYQFNRWGGPWAVIPLTDYRGTPITVANGRRLPCEAPSSTCALVEWPSGYRAYHSEREAAPKQSWFGSLVRNSADDSGLMYRRNRYYNPATGLFTQPDPIGLAGGLNTYGFADGDPVGYSDPYGLSAGQTCPPVCPLPGVGPIPMPTPGMVEDAGRFLEWGIRGAQRLQTALILAPAVLVGRLLANETPGEILMPGGEPIGEAGSKPGIREVPGSVDDAEEMFGQLTEGGRKIQSNYPGTLVALPGGGTVGIRTKMTNSPGTAANIDVNIPGIPIDKIKFNP